MSKATGKTMAMSVEGLAVRLVTFTGKRVVDWYDVPLNPGWVRGGIISRPDDVGKAVAKTIEENNAPRRGVLSALSSSGSSAQVLNMPGVKKSKIDAVVGREMRRVSAGSNFENDYIYSQPLPKPKHGTQREVYALTVPKRNVLNLVEACNAAGLTMKAVELKPFALARAVGCQNGIIVHADVDGIEIVIIDNSFPVSFRSVSVNNGDGPEAAFQQLLSELPRTIDHYNRTHPDTPLGDDTAIYLSGGLALNPELVMGVVEVTGREVANIEPPVECPPDFPLAQYMTHVGLMLKG
ncbi:MAG: hypothetical protein V3S51_06985 [Dehalococcoidia bacterium]